VIRFSALVLGLCLAAYGSVGLWLSHTTDRGLHKSFCEAGLCPLEFSPARVYELQYNSRTGHAGQAIPEFQREVKADSASPYAWADLGEALASAHELRLADYCMRSAVAAGPNSPAILMRAANVSLSAGNNQAAMSYLSRVLRDPTVKQYFPAVFLTYNRMGVPIEDVLAHDFPASSGAGEAILRYSIQAQRVPDAEAVWHWMAAHNLQNDALAADYLRFLIAAGHEQAAAEEWAQLNRNWDPDYRRQNWIFDGGFEQAARSGPLDWRIEANPNVEVVRSAAMLREGKWSLELKFAGFDNTNFEGVYQDTVLAPGKWRLRASLKTSGITTDQGVGLRVYDAAQTRRMDARTETLTGTHDWTRLEREFEVHPETKLVRVEVFREPSTRFDNRIEGRAWIDCVELVPVR